MATAMLVVYYLRFKSIVAFLFRENEAQNLRVRKIDINNFDAPFFKLSTEILNVTNGLAIVELCSNALRQDFENCPDFIAMFTKNSNLVHILAGVGDGLIHHRFYTASIA